MGKIIAIITASIALLGLIFGQNMYDRFFGSKIVLTSTKIDYNISDILREFAPEKLMTEKDSFLPNTIRIIKIKNEGSLSSSNINIVATLDGKILQYKLNSTETISTKQVDQEKLLLTLPRLSRNADITLICWIKDNSNKFQISYADDKNSGLIEDISQTTNNFSYITIVLLTVLFVSFWIIAKDFFDKYNSKLENERTENTAKLLQQLYEFFKENDTDDTKNAIASSVSPNDTQKHLEGLIKLVQKNKPT
jgi:hypothetical protein